MFSFVGVKVVDLDVIELEDVTELVEVCEDIGEFLGRVDGVQESEPAGNTGLSILLDQGSVGIHGW